MKSFDRLPRWAGWGFMFPLLVLNGWLLIVVFEYFKSLIGVCVTASLLAFILNYPVEFLVYHRVKRTRAVFLVIGTTLILLGVLALTLAPLIVAQLDELTKRLPSWIESGQQQMLALNAWAIKRRIPLNISGLSTQLTERFSTQLQSLTGQILDLILGTVDRVFNLFLTLVITFYFLLQGEELWEGLWHWLPFRCGVRVRPLLRQNFHNYYVAQASLAAIFGISMTLAFLFLGVPFGALFGLGIGLMAFFPFGAALGIWLVSLLMALQSFWLGVKVLTVAAIVQQIIENGIAPRLLGGFIGLNPVWILISLLIGGRLSGILGLLVAVPLAGFIKSVATVLRATSSYDSN